MNILEALILLCFFMTLITAENIPVCLVFVILTAALGVTYYILWRRNDG